MNVPGLFAAAGPTTLSAGFGEAERVLGEALKEFAAELKLAGAADLAAFVRLEQMPNLQDLVRSSAELYFKPGALELAETGELEMSWFSPPLITFPLIFRHAGVFVYFRLRLAALTASVEIETINTEAGAVPSEFHLALQSALNGARLESPSPA